MPNISTAAKSENLKSSKPERNNSFGTKSDAATAAKFATSSSFTRRATGPRTPQGKERSKFNARKHGLFSKAILLQNESRTEYDALLDGLMENFQPQGKLEIVLVEYLATLLWRKRRLLQVETAEIEKAPFLNWDLILQKELDGLEYAQLKGPSDAKPERSKPLLLLRNAIEILNILRQCFMAGDSKNGDAWRRTLKSVYGYQDGGPEPDGWSQMWLMQCKLLTSAKQRKEDTDNPPDVKQSMVQAIREEIMRLAELHDTAANVEAQRQLLNLVEARVPSQEVSDLLIRYGAHFSREFDRTLSQLERLQRIRKGQPVLPELKVRHSLS